MTLKKGSWAWIGLTAYVIGYDAWAMRTRNETLSMAFSRALQRPLRRWPVTIGSTIIYAHLMLPQKYHKYDPLRIAVRGFVKGD